MNFSVRSKTSNYFSLALVAAAVLGLDGHSKPSTNNASLARTNSAAMLMAPNAVNLQQEIERAFVHKDGKYHCLVASGMTLTKVEFDFIKKYLADKKIEDFRPRTGFKGIDQNLNPAVWALAKAFHALMQTKPNLTEDEYRGYIAMIGGISMKLKYPQTFGLKPSNFISTSLDEIQKRIKTTLEELVASDPRIQGYEVQVFANKDSVGEPLIIWPDLHDVKPALGRAFYELRYAQIRASYALSTNGIIERFVAEGAVDQTVIPPGQSNQLTFPALADLAVRQHLSADTVAALRLAHEARNPMQIQALEDPQLFVEDLLLSLTKDILLAAMGRPSRQKFHVEELVKFINGQGPENVNSRLEFCTQHIPLITKWLETELGRQERQAIVFANGRRIVLPKPSALTIQQEAARIELLIAYLSRLQDLYLVWRNTSMRQKQQANRGIESLVLGDGHIVPWLSNAHLEPSSRPVVLITPKNDLGLVLSVPQPSEEGIAVAAAALLRAELSGIGL